MVANRPYNPNDPTNADNQQSYYSGGGKTYQDFQNELANVTSIDRLYSIYSRSPYRDEQQAAAEKMQALTGLPSIVGYSLDDLKLKAQGYEQETKLKQQGEEQQKKIEDFYAKQEEKQRLLAEQQKKEMQDYATQYRSSYDKQREDIAKNLLNLSQEAFNMETPYRMEQLNTGGFYDSPTAIANANAEAMRKLELERENKLLDLDVNAFNTEQGILGTGLGNYQGNMQNVYNTGLAGGWTTLETGLGADSDALTAALNAGTAMTQRNFDLTDQQAALNQQNQLAKKQMRNQLLSSLISAGGSIGGGFATGGASSLFSKGV